MAIDAPRTGVAAFDGLARGDRRRARPRPRSCSSRRPTGTLYAALKQLEVIREGFVVRNLDGSQKTDGEADAAMRRICRRAGLPVHGFHRLCHSFGTHAALFGVNPWRLQAWTGHKRIDETMPIRPKP